jgi:hypothetical protein
MSNDLSPRTMKHLGLLSAAIITVAACIFVILAIKTPSRVDHLKAFLGPGEILESASAREGWDHTYWARYKCDPVAVRTHLKTHTYPQRKSGTQRLEQYFTGLRFNCPANMDHFQTDWIVFTVGVGFYRLVAFPDDDSSEVFIFEFDN